MRRRETVFKDTEKAKETKKELKKLRNKLKEATEPKAGARDATRAGCMPHTRRQAGPAKLIRAQGGCLGTESRRKT